MALLPTIGRWLVVAATLALGACIHRLPSAEVADGVSTIEGPGGALPIRWVRGAAFAEVSVGGAAPRRFLVDTGASALLVTPHLADDLGLVRASAGSSSRGIRVKDARGALLSARETVRIAQMTSGPFTLRDADALVMNTDDVESALGAPIDGFLPGTAFRGYLLTFDFPNRAVTVGRGELPAAGSDVLDLESDPLPTIQIALGGHRVRLLIDTGSNGFLSLPAAVAAGFGFRSTPAETGRVATLGGISPSKSARLAGTIQLGSHRLADPIVDLDPNDVGRIGFGLLRSFRVTFDLAHRRVRLERATAEPIHCPPLRSIGAGMRIGPDGWTVAYVLDGSPAARAGLNPGDRIVTMDGQPVAQISPPEFESLEEETAPVRLGVVRGAGVRELEIRLATLVE